MLPEAEDPAMDAAAEMVPAAAALPEAGAAVVQPAYLFYCGLLLNLRRPEHAQKWFRGAVAEHAEYRIYQAARLTGLPAETIRGLWEAAGKPQGPPQARQHLVGLTAAHVEAVVAAHPPDGGKATDYQQLLADHVADFGCPTRPARAQFVIRSMELVPRLAAEVILGERAERVPPGLAVAFNAHFGFGFEALTKTRQVEKRMLEFLTSIGGVSHQSGREWIAGAVVMGDPEFDERAVDAFFARPLRNGAALGGRATEDLRVELMAHLRSRRISWRAFEHAAVLRRRGALRTLFGASYRTQFRGLIAERVGGGNRSREEATRDIFGWNADELKRQYGIHTVGEFAAIVNA